ILFRDTIRDALQPIAGEETVKSGMLLLILLPLLVGAVWMGIVTHRAERPTGKCPHCGRGLWQQLRQLTATGNCVRCGGRRPALPPPEPRAASAPRIPIAEVLAAERATVRMMLRRLGVGAALCAAIVIAWAIVAAGGRRERFGAEMEQRLGPVNAVLIETAIG